jgi:hypothetical protein
MGNLISAQAKMAKFSYRTARVYMQAADQNRRGLRISSLAALLKDERAAKAEKHTPARKPDAQPKRATAVSAAKVIGWTLAAEHAVGGTLPLGFSRDQLGRKVERGGHRAEIGRRIGRPIADRRAGARGGRLRICAT